jgi:cysteinyl-tRNA synthetase
MIDTITKIIGNGHAYVLEDGDVYFDVVSLPGESEEV